MLLTMPHLQPDTAQKKHRKNTVERLGFGINSSSPGTEELPIQVATPNFLGASDPDVAMANKVSSAVVESSFESVEQNDSRSLSSPSQGRVSKAVITPTSSIGSNINSPSSSASSDDGSAAETELVSSKNTNAGHILTKVCSTSRLSHSPILVKRRVSQTEGEEILVTSKEHQQSEIKQSTYLNYGESPPTAISTGPAIIRRGSSLTLGIKSTDVEPSEELPKTKSTNVKIEDCDTAGKASTAESVASASTNANIKKRKSVSPTTTDKKTDDAQNEIRQSLPAVHHPHHIMQPGFRPGVVATPAFHSHPAAFGGHPFASTGIYTMGYPGYPPHAPPSAVPPFVGGQYPGHPAAGFYAPYPPGFHPHPMHQHGPTFVPPYGHAMNATVPGSKVNPTNSTTKAQETNGKNNQMTVIPSMYTRTNSAMDQSSNSSMSAKSEIDGMPISANRCVPLQEPIPAKHWGKAETAEGRVLPDFHRLVNYPDYLSKSRGVGSGDTGGPKAVGGKKHCVMCGKLRICSASSLTEKGRAAACSDDGTAHIIPRQNKGLCTACDVTVWVLVSEGLEIKWCKGCKNFRSWAAFGDKGSATKCVRCRERQREKYAMQKNAKRTRRSERSEVSTKSELPGHSSSIRSSPNQRNGSVKERKDSHFAAARGLTSLMHAAAAL